jgi:phosphoribosyl 1,2-cyclic phosphate phosphodiesterase
MKGQIIFLGTGASTGIPLIGCNCSVCTSKNPKDIRTRTSAVISLDGKRFVIDIGPDFRQQALTHRVTTIDGILLTHTHYDHIAGLDELRVIRFFQKKKIPILCSVDSAQELYYRYYYLFDPETKESPLVTLQCLQEDQGKIHFEGIDLEYVSYYQIGMKVIGFKIGTLAYLTDIQQWDPDTFSHLKDVETLVISALKQDRSKAHLSIDEAIALSQDIGARKTYFTHIGHECDHEHAQSLLPKGISLAYDGLTVDFHYDI